MAQQGNALLNQGRYTEAVTSFDSALAQNPNNIAARVGKGTALFSSGRPSEALLSFEIALNQNAAYVPALLEQGRVLLATGNPEGALVSFNQALALNPGDVTALEGKGDALSALGQGGEAVTAWNDALSNDPGNTGIREKIASAKENSGFPLLWWIIIAVLIVLVTSALFLHMRSSPERKTVAPNNPAKKVPSEKIPPGNTTRNKKIRTTPVLRATPGHGENPVPGRQRFFARLQGMLNGTGMGAGILSGKKPADEKTPGRSGHPGISGHASDIRELSKADLPDIALDEPENTGSSSGSVNEITRSLETLLKTRDESYSGAGLKGILLYSNGEYEAALTEFDKELISYPGIVGVALLKVRALMHLGRLSEAFNADRQVLKRARDNYESIVLAALLADRLGHLEFGEKACNKAITFRHNAPEIWALKGKIQHKLGNYKDAISSLKQSLDLDGESGETWKQYGMVLGRLGRYNEAISAFEKVILLTGENPKIRTWIVTCRNHLNNRSEYSGTAAAQRPETGAIPEADPPWIRDEAKNERTDTERKDLEFFPAFDHHTLMDRPGPGAHEQKSS